MSSQAEAEAYAWVRWLADDDWGGLVDAEEGEIFISRIPNAQAIVDKAVREWDPDLCK